MKTTGKTFIRKAQIKDREKEIRKEYSQRKIIKNKKGAKNKKPE